MAKDDVYVATDTFATEINGVPQVIHEGITRVRAGHELLKRFPDWFAPVDTGVDYDVEQATAAPGEKRGEQAAQAQEAAKVQQHSQSEKRG